MKHSINRITQAALALAAAAVVIPTGASAARPDDRAVGPRTQGTQVRIQSPAAVQLDHAYLRALRLRGEAMNRLYGEGASFDGYKSSYPQLHELGVAATDGVEARVGVGEMTDAYTKAHLSELRNPVFRTAAPETAVRPDDRAGIRSIGSTQAIAVPESGFDWSDAGIGALGGVGASLLAGAMLLALQHRRRQQDRIAVL